VLASILTHPQSLDEAQSPMLLSVLIIEAADQLKGFT
jgi:hypothetical protein